MNMSKESGSTDYFKRVFIVLLLIMRAQQAKNAIYMFYWNIPVELN